MALLHVRVSSGEVVMVAATAKTVLQIKAPANQRLVIKRLEVMGKQPAGGTDTPSKIRLTRSTANFGTATGAATTDKNNPSNGETLQGTYGYNFTAEPTSPTDAGRTWEVNPQLGVIDDLVQDKWIEVPGGQAINVEITAAATPTWVVDAFVEE
jgi:hypothetical protein